MANWDVLHVQSLEVKRDVAEDLIRQWLAEGRMSRDDCVRVAGDERWWHIYERNEFRASLESRAAAMEEPPRLEVESLRKVLAEAEPPQEVRAERRAGTPVAQPARRTAAKPAGPTSFAPPAYQPPFEQPAPSEPLFPPKRPVTEQEDIDMAPACTVSFLLILFFVIVSTIALQMAIAFPKPSPDDRTKAQQDIPQNWDDLKKDNIVVEVKADNSIWIDNEQIRDIELVNRITNLKRDRATLNLILKADDDSYHETVVAVVDAGTRAGMQNIKLANVTKVVKKSAKKRAVAK
jgi:biopolymer transport protein ExbD